MERPSMVDPPVIYQFEEIAEDLPRPPMAAMRALLSTGVLVSPMGWQTLPLDVRRQFVGAGSSERVDPQGMASLLRHVPVSQVKFIGRTVDPGTDDVPARLVAAIGPTRPLTVGEWRSLRGLDRYVLASLAGNLRLLRRALSEVLPRVGAPSGVASAWAGEVARADIRVRHDVFSQVATAHFLDGRGFVLAKAAGRRAARRASELLDEHADGTVGHVEVAWGARPSDDVIFWQAHVSTWDGRFFPAAALLAATTAAVALCDMIRSFDPDAALVGAAIKAEPWQAGRDEDPDAATAMYMVPAQVHAAPREVEAAKTTIQAAPPAMTEPMLERPPGDRPFAGHTLPLVPPSTPALAQPLSRAPTSDPNRPVVVARGPASDVRPTSSRDGAGSSRVGGRLTVPTWLGVAVLVMTILTSVAAILGLALMLRHHG